MFKRQTLGDTQTVTVIFEGQHAAVPAGISVAAAVLSLGVGHTRTSAVSGMHRAPYCQMGICFECLMEIDGIPNRQACMIRVEEGMQISRQLGPRKIKP